MEQYNYHGSMVPDLSNVAKAMKELGASMSAYGRGGSYAGNSLLQAVNGLQHDTTANITPPPNVAYVGGYHAGNALPHAASRLNQTTGNLPRLNHTTGNLPPTHGGANPSMMNDDCQTALNLARLKGHWNVVHAIENQICLFCGWLRKLKGLRILGTFAERKILAVVLPCDSHSPMTSRNLELIIYPGLQAAQTCVAIALWNVHIEDPKFYQPDPTLVIVDMASKTQHKFLSANKGDRWQLQRFYNACRGISQQNSHIPVAPAGATPTPNSSHPNSDHASSSSVLAHSVFPEDKLLDMAIKASIKSALAEGVHVPNAQPASPKINTSGWNLPENTTYNNSPAPSAPPIIGLEAFYGGGNSEISNLREGSRSNDSSSFCVICLDAPVEGACVPCGHMAGCMSCLNEIKGKNFGCPLCRANINQVIRVYAA